MVKMRNIVVEALQRLIDEESILFDININERTLTHRLAIYLEELMKDKYPEYDVDCEYNRNELDKKILYGLIENIKSDDKEGKIVYPDIIIHKRNSTKKPYGY